MQTTNRFCQSPFPLPSAQRLRLTHSPDSRALAALVARPTDPTLPPAGTDLRERTRAHFPINGDRLLSLDSFGLEELKIAAVESLSVLVFLMSTTLVKEMLPVVLRRRDKYDVNSDD